jgi:uncharacterized membrane protein HdeD (DUF308 family)
VINTPRFHDLLESGDHHSGWTMTLRGVLAVIFGVVTVRSPNVAASVFVVVFAVYAFLDAILDFVLAARLGRLGQRWGWYLFEGVVSVAAGIIALAYPQVTILAAVLLIGLRAIVIGVLEVVAAFAWAGLDSRWLLGLTGVTSVLLGILLLASPATGAVALLWIIGVYAFVYGIMLFALGVRLLWSERHEHGGHSHGPATTAG